MRPPFDISADLDTPVSAFLKLRPFGARLLLESVEGGETLARYSFLGFNGGPEVRLDGASFEGDAKGALGALRRALREAPRPVAHGEPLPGVPFQGGLVGVAAYDLVRAFERLPARAHAAGGEPLAAYLAPRSLLVFDHLTRRAALLHDGGEDERARLRAEVVRALRGPLPPPAPAGRHEPAVPSLAAGDFCAAVTRARAHITAGDVFQLVLSVRFTGETDLDPFTVYRALRLTNPSPYMYFLDLGDRQVAGSSPEALVRLDGRRAALRPIAGTRARGADEEQDRAAERELLADPKEAAEHVMLVDLARNDLGRVAVPGTIEVRPSRAVERYSHVMHLVSGVTGVLAPEHDAFDLFAAAFPAGTVTGAPKVRAMELIDELEPTPRGLYAGTVGYFGHGGATDQALAIRTLVFGEGRYTYQAGAGVVADSDPRREHAEVLAKGAALAGALALAEEIA